jgi:solute:Na+ symporter, SSS family
MAGSRAALAGGMPVILRFGIGRAGRNGLWLAAMEASGVHVHFTALDWGVLAGYLLFTTWIGHRLRGKQATIRDFFLGGRSLPWPAVSGSIIATEISGVTFVGVPAMMFAAKGDFTYLQWAVGSIIGRVLVAWWFVKVYYEQEIFSPYDYMGRRLGSGAKTLATVLFTIGSILGQSVRVLVAALPLRVVTNLDLGWCILIIGLFAVGWTLMGGMRTVIWTDVVQFVIFLSGGLLALGWIVASLPGGFGELREVAARYGRLDLLDTRLQADLQFTLWVALLAVPFQNLCVFGVDQLNAQRMFCCRDAAAARKALVWSSAGQLLTALMLLVGAALFVHYDRNPFTPAEAVVLYEKTDPAAALAAMEEAPLLAAKSGEPVSNVRQPGKADYVFPLWITTVLPAGVSGLVLAGIFAAAISSLDSILAALSQTTLSLIYHPENRSEEELAELNLLVKSKLLVVFWGLALTGFTFLLNYAKEAQQLPVLPLAFGMTSYTVGPLLAIMLCALAGRGSVAGLVAGACLSVALTAFVRMDLWVLLEKAGMAIDWLAALPGYRLEDGALKPVVDSSWAWPVTTILTLACGLLWPARRGGHLSDPAERRV